MSTGTEPATCHPSDWPYRTWLGLIHTGDNHGPPRPDEVRRILDEIGQQMPGVKVRIGRLSDFADAILAKENLDAIPIVRGDTPDTWIHGPMCDPQGRIAARRAHANLPTAESLTTMLESWGVGAAKNADQPTPWQSIANGYEQSLLYGEHTWGASLGWVGHGLPWGPDWQKQTDERHRRMVASWDEHSAYANQAQAISTSLLDGQLQRLSQSIDSDRHRAAVYNPLPWKRDGLALIDGETHFVHDVPPMGYRTLFSPDSEQPRAEAGLARKRDASVRECWRTSSFASPTTRTRDASRRWWTSEPIGNWSGRTPKGLAASSTSVSVPTSATNSCTTMP